MIIIKSSELLRAVQNAYHFDFKHSKCISESDGQFTGNFWHETYEGFGIEITYYFQGNDLFGYEYDVEKNRKELEEKLKKVRGSKKYKNMIAEAYKDVVAP